MCTVKYEVATVKCPLCGTYDNDTPWRGELCHGCFSFVFVNLIDYGLDYESAGHIARSHDWENERNITVGEVMGTDDGHYCDFMNRLYTRPWIAGNTATNLTEEQATLKKRALKYAKEQAKAKRLKQNQVMQEIAKTNRLQEDFERLRRQAEKDALSRKQQLNHERYEKYKARKAQRMAQEAEARIKAGVQDVIAETAEERKKRLNRESGIRYYEGHKEEIKARKKDWYERNREKLSATRKLKYKDNVNGYRDKRLELNNKWRAFQKAKEGDARIKTGVQTVNAELATPAVPCETEEEKAKRLKRERDARYYEKHKEEINAKKRERYNANSEKEKAKSRERYEQHKEEMAKRKRKYNQEHREELKEKKRLKYQNNVNGYRDKMLEQQRKKRMFQKAKREAEQKGLI